MRIALVYGTTLGNTEEVANLILQEFNSDLIDIYNVANIKAKDINHYSKYIFGSSTWGLGDMQDDWEQFDFKNLIVENKTVALFGLGDSEIYAFSYCDCLFKMHEILKRKKAHIVGYVKASDYQYTESSSVNKDGYFLGLALDNENYKELTPQRIKDWVTQIRPLFLDEI